MQGKDIMQCIIPVTKSVCPVSVWNLLPLPYVCSNIEWSQSTW